MGRSNEDKNGNASSKEAAIASAAQKQDADASDSDESSSDDSDDDDLILEGVLVRNPEASDSSSDSEEEEEVKRPEKKRKLSQDKNSSKQKKQDTSKKKKGKKKSEKGGPEIVPMDFTFCDMDEKFFHGIKNLLVSSSPAYLATASSLSDLMIKNVAVGTVISTEYQYKPGQKRDMDYEGVVYGFASVLNVTTYKDNDAIKALKKMCLSKCPEDRKKELEVVLSGKTKRPAGFYFQSRMVNLPLEIVEVLHEQLIQDMDWAVENAGGGIEERKSLDFGAFVRIAPSYREKNTSYFKYFDDEILANHAEFTFEFEVPKTFGMEETPYCTAIVMTKTGHRAAIKTLKQMINGSG